MWEQIRSNRRRSILLVLLIAVLLFALGYAIGEAFTPGGGPVGLLIALGVWIFLGLLAYFQGDAILLSVSGAREIDKQAHPRLFNIVEEMTIAAGLPKMPRVYVIEDTALNAFATGRKPENAAVAVTAGLLAKLNRDQLQGVIAHEMSHVVNRDVLLMTVAGIMLGAIVMVSEFFLRSLWHTGSSRRMRRYSSSSRRGGGGGGQAIMMVVAIVLAILAPLLAQLLYLAISRRREYLADANAAALTRYPEGLASALEAIASGGANVAAANKATAPMYIANPFQSRALSALTSTHPPIDERIRILRTMAGQAGFNAYDQAYRAIHDSRRGIIPPSAMGLAEALPAREAVPDAGEPETPRARVREAGDLVQRMNDYRFVTCQCGLKMKIPPDFPGDAVQCPRCKQVSNLQS